MGAPVGNRYAVGNNGGRPPVYTTPEALEAKILEYFTWIEGDSHIEKRVHTDKKTDESEIIEVKVWDREPVRATITGFALFLGFDSKQSLYDYKKKEEFSYSIKRGLTFIENDYENALFGQSPAGAIFALKNMDWKDKTEHDLNIFEQPLFPDVPTNNSH